MRPKSIPPEAAAGLSCRPDQLAAYRHVLGLPQSKLQEQLGMAEKSGSTIADLERCKRPASPFILLLLRNHLREHLPDALDAIYRILELIGSLSTPGEPVSPAGDQRTRQIIRELADLLDQLKTGEEGDIIQICDSPHVFIADLCDNKDQEVRG